MKEPDKTNWSEGWVVRFCDRVFIFKGQKPSDEEYRVLMKTHQALHALNKTPMCDVTFGVELVPPGAIGEAGLTT